MRNTRKPAGVIVRDAHLQIDLRAVGFGRERLELAPTPANINYAGRLRSEILGKIERGTFVLADYFPDSPRIAKDTASTTWPKLAGEWLQARRKLLEHSTVHHYEQTLTSKHFADWQSLHVGDLDYRRLMAKLAALPDHPKTFNNVASVLRMVLEFGHLAKLIREPLHQHVEMRRQQKPQPDPLTLAEVDLVLGKIKDARGRNYFEFACFTGLRPSELIALKWSAVDLRAGTVTVAEAVTRSKTKGTKTGQVRLVELNSRARAALEAQRAITQLAGGHVFIGLDGQPYTTTDGPLDAFWKPAMKVSGLRYRDARQTRHTYATICLHAGLTPAWVARQLGHSAEMFFRVYSKWIEGADHGAERRKLDAFMAGGKVEGTGT